MLSSLRCCCCCCLSLMLVSRKKSVSPNGSLCRQSSTNSKSLIQPTVVNLPQKPTIRPFYGTHRDGACSRSTIGGSQKKEATVSKYTVAPANAAANIGLKTYLRWRREYLWNLRTLVRVLKQHSTIRNSNVYSKYVKYTNTHKHTHANHGFLNF